MSHYKNLQVESINDLRDLFPEGKANELNWCIFSTSGVHGTGFVLDEIEYSLENDLDEAHKDYCPPKITCLVIKPRLVTLGWGNIEVDLEDIPFLRKLAASSLNQINKSQQGNI